MHINSQDFMGLKESTTPDRVRVALLALKYCPALANQGQSRHHARPDSRPLARQCWIQW